MQPGPPRRRRARPVADAPIGELLARSEDLAKGWLLALLEQVSLDDAPEILAASISRDGPRVCEAVVRALASDEDLRRIQPGGPLELLISQAGKYAGARSAEGISCAVDAMHAVIWSAMRDALSHPDPDQISELAERLSLVTELVREAALRGSTLAPLRAAPSSPSHQEAVPSAGEDALRQSAGEDALRQSAGEDGPRPSAGEDPPRQSAGVPHPSLGAPHPRAVADRRVAPAPESLWMGALDDEIVRAEHARLPLALLLVELDEVDRMLAVEPPPEAAAILGRFAHAVRAAMRRNDILACETDTRAWVVARDTGRAGAQALGSRIAGAVRTAQAWRGAPLSASIGVAILGEDGHDRAGLIDAAEEDRFAAAASGIGIIRAAPDERIRTSTDQEVHRGTDEGVHLNTGEAVHPAGEAGEPSGPEPTLHG